MSATVVGRLILKDLFLTRWMVIGSIVAGLAALAVIPRGAISAYVGGVSLICVFIVLNIFLVMQGVVQERKDRVMLFVLSLPVSTTQYMLGKVLASVIAFAGPWLLLTAATIAVIDASDIPNGIVPFWLTVLGYLLSYFLVLLAISLVSDSTGWHAAAITIGNISVNFFIPFLLARPAIAGHRDGPAAVWTTDIVAILIVEILAGVAALGLAVYVHSRRRDFV